MTQPILRRAPPNTQRRVMWMASGVTFLCVVVAVLFGVLGQTQDRYAGVVLSGFAGTCGLVTALVYRPRARAFDRLFNAEPPLVVWEYSHREWVDYVQENFLRDRADNWGLWLLMAVICLVVGGIMAVLDILFLWITLGLALFLLIPALGVPKLRRWRLLHHPHRAFINRNAVWIGGRFQTWTLLGARLVSVEIDTHAAPRLLCITFQCDTRTGPQDEIVRVPIPLGQDAAAETVVKELQKEIR